MLQDILSPFHQFVTRAGRAAYPGGRPSAEGPAGRRLVVRVGAPGNSATTAEPALHPDDRVPADRISPEPGPGEVVPPGWW